MGFTELLVVVLIVALIALLARIIYRVIRGLMTGGDTRTPDEILEDRYKRGEIDAGELVRGRKKLHRH